MYITDLLEWTVIRTFLGVCGFACRRYRDCWGYILLAVGMWGLGRLAQETSLLAEGMGIQHLCVRGIQRRPVFSCLNKQVHFWEMKAITSMVVFLCI